MTRSTREHVTGNSPEPSILSPEEGQFSGAPKDFALTLAKGMRLLEMFTGDVTVVTLQTAAVHLGTSRATARRLLKTLQALGYLRQVAPGYRLTSRCLTISRAFLDGSTILQVLARAVCKVSADLSCPCSIVSLSGPDVLFLCRDPSRRVYAAQLALGDRLPAHSSSGGKLLLAQKGDRDLAMWFARYAPAKLTDRTIGTLAGLQAEAAVIRACDYATADGELEEGLVSLAVPIKDHLGHAGLALVISKFTKNMSQVDFIADHLPQAQDAAANISRAYGDYLVHQS